MEGNFVLFAFIVWGEIVMITFVLNYFHITGLFTWKIHTKDKLKEEAKW